MRCILGILLIAAVSTGCTTPAFRGSVDGPGSEGKELIDAKNHPRLVLEVEYPPNAPLDSGALDDWKSTIATATHRDPSNVVVQTHATVPSNPGKKYSLSELRELESKVRPSVSDPQAAVLNMLVVDGGSADDTSKILVFGVTYGGASTAIFQGNIQSQTDDSIVGTKPHTRFVERAVLIHETGHAFGLVNLGLKMQRPHEDSSNPGHSTNPSSVMWPQVESSAGLLDVVQRGSSIPYQFDSDDQADIDAGA